MASERVLDVSVHRHVFDTDRPFARVLDGIFSGISQPDIAQLFSKLAASSTYEEFGSLVEQAQCSQVADTSARCTARCWWAWTQQQPTMERAYWQT